MSSGVIYSLMVLGLMGLGCGTVLAIFGRLFNVKADPRVDEVEKALPGLNCGVCGQASCHAMAEAIVEGREQPNKCAPGGQAVVERVSAVLGVKEDAAEPRVAAVRCQGGWSKGKEKADYEGIRDCAVVELLGGGAKACMYGCLGFGTCVDACPFGAIRMTEDRLPEIVEERCTGCGKCIDACPRRIITLIPRGQKVYLGCVNREKGKAVKEWCEKGCIACGLCARPTITPSGKVEMRGNLPYFPADWEDYRTAVEKCPDGCFVIRNTRTASSVPRAAFKT